MKPVYMINGFLDSGKTEFIVYTLSQQYFQIRGKTLLVLCEEGEIEYDPELLRKSKTEVAVIEDEAGFTADALMELDKQYKPERIIIEFNGMWNPKNVKLPWFWTLEQQITTINAATFPMYYTNMKSLVAEQARNSDLIIFNRCDGIQDLNVFKRNLKAVNQKADIVFEDSNGEINEIFEEDLPYKLDEDPIDLTTNEKYGIWYLDTFDHLERYDGKRITFIAQVAKPEQIKKGFFVPGRMAMTCCAEDMTFLGYACQYDKIDALTPKQWVKVTARVKCQYWEDYEGEGPVLYAESVEPVKAPKDEIISFTA
ncbi:MAG: GTPase [Lachnospiraceae bacterium]|nr:GTPase [Lachnospiraceae bacterium]